jgi:hypothetical protein
MNRENNTGVLPPEGEESAEFESVNANANVNANAAEPRLESTEGSNGNTPLGNAPESAAPNAPEPPAVEPNVTELNGNANAPMNATTNATVNATANLPAPTATKQKKPQSAKQQGTIAAQAQERASLKSAGVAKPSVAMVATLASMKAKGDTKYEAAFANAVAGRPLNSYRTAKTKKKGKKNETATNTSSVAGLFSRNAGVTAKNKRKGVNSGTQASSRFTSAMSQTNMRNRNMVNSQALNATVDSVLDIAESIGKQMGEMKRLIKTLKAKKPAAPRASRKKNSVANALPGNNSLLGLPALPPIPPVPSQFNTALSIIPEVSNEGTGNTAYTPPP